MNTERRQIVVGGLPVQIVRKAIKNLHLGVYPPNGRVRVAAPLAVSDRAVRLAVVGKLGWIKRQRARFADQPRQSRRELVSGETHYFLGRRYRLRVIEHPGPGRVVLRSRTTLELWVRAGSDANARDQVLQRWYRDRLRELVPPLLAKWEPVLGVHAADWRIKEDEDQVGRVQRGCRPDLAESGSGEEARTVPRVPRHPRARPPRRATPQRSFPGLDGKTPSAVASVSGRAEFRSARARELELLSPVGTDGSAIPPLAGGRKRGAPSGAERSPVTSASVASTRWGCLRTGPALGGPEGSMRCE